MVAKEIKIGLISDTHGSLEEDIVKAFDGVDHIVHAGDVGQESVLEGLKEIAPVTAVRGNIDGGPLRFLPREELISFHGIDIAVLHIAGSPRRPRQAARELIGRLKPDILVVGHSHIEVVGKVGNTLWINPGAAGRQGFHQERTAYFLYIGPAGELRLERVIFGPRSRQGRRSN